MTEYIERGAAMKAVMESKDRDDALVQIQFLYAADVEPVVRARWLPDNADACCTNCFAPKPRDDYGTIISAEYCYGCGAHMDLKEERK